jgi:hypothetical protein
MELTNSQNYSPDFRNQTNTPNLQRMYLNTDIIPRTLTKSRDERLKARQECNTFGQKYNRTPVAEMNLKNHQLSGQNRYSTLNSTQEDGSKAVELIPSANSRIKVRSNICD